MLPRIYQIPKGIRIYYYLFLLKEVDNGLWVAFIWVGQLHVTTKDANVFVTINNKFRTLVKNTWNSLAVQWLGLGTFTAVACVQFRSGN